MSGEGEITITEKRYRRYQEAERAVRNFMRRETDLLSFMDARHQEAFEAQNRALFEQGEELLTAFEYVQCRLEDAEAALAAIGALPAKWLGRRPLATFLGKEMLGACAEELETVLEQHDV